MLRQLRLHPLMKLFHQWPAVVLMEAQSVFRRQFLFPRQRNLSLEDSEVEFNVKAGEVPIKQRFKLKDMVFNGKVEM